MPTLSQPPHNKRCFQGCAPESHQSPARRSTECNRYSGEHLRRWKARCCPLLGRLRHLSPLSEKLFPSMTERPPSTWTELEHGFLYSGREVLALCSVTVHPALQTIITNRFYCCWHIFFFREEKEYLFMQCARVKQPARACPLLSRASWWWQGLYLLSHFTDPRLIFQRRDPWNTFTSSHTPLEEK